MLLIHAPAKINLSLEVLGRRDNGYHELSTVVQNVTLRDDVILRLWPEIRVTCSDDRLSGPQNLVSVALEKLRRRLNVGPGCWAHVQKRIPVAAGLGGGSSDAAAALVGAVRLWSLEASCDDLVDVASQVGSDVPFFLFGGACWVVGRGERVMPQPPVRQTWYLLANPGTPISTARVFAELEQNDQSDGSDAVRILRQRREGIASLGRNALQRACFRISPEAKRCFDMIESIAPNRTFLSGSGATVAAMFESRAEAVEAYDRVVGSIAWTCVASSLDSRDWRNACASG